LELCSASERKQIEEKERNLKSFFSAMEANVLRNIQRGDVTGSLVDEEARKRRESDPNLTTEDHDTFMEDGELVESSFRKESDDDDAPPVTRVVRTISSMDDLLLTELTRTKSNTSMSQNYNSNSSLPHPSLDDSANANQISSLASAAGDIRQMRSFRSLSISHAASSTSLNRQASNDSQDSIDEAYAKNNADGPTGGKAPSTASSNGPTPPLLNNSGSTPSPLQMMGVPDAEVFRPPLLQHRNSGSTLFVGSTMSAPDTHGMIACVCGLFRAHMVQYATEEAKGILTASFEGVFPQYDVFNDKEYSKVGTIEEKDSEKDSFSEKEDLKVMKEEIMARVPSLKEVTKFFADLYRKSQMESDCIIMSLIYVERLLKQTKGGIKLTYKNWKSVVFSSMVMSSKVWDDLSMWNADFSQVCSSFTLQRINELELAMLDALRYDVKVKASEYAKYYFLLRSKLMESGLGGDHIESLQPLDIVGAKQLETLSEEYEVAATSQTALKRRAVSMNDFDEDTEIKIKLPPIKAGKDSSSKPGTTSDKQQAVPHKPDGQAKRKDSKRNSIKPGVSLEQVVHQQHTQT